MPDPVQFDRLIYGGSFDPPHRGHVAIVEHVLRHSITRAIDLIPAAVSPFKQDAPPTSGVDRLALLHAALSEFEREHSKERIRVRTLELDRPPPSYSADTCAALRALFPGQTLGLLIGSDSLRELHLWTRIASILEHHPVCVFQRDSESRAESEAISAQLATDFAGARFHLLDNPLVPCASSAIRAQLAAGVESAVADCLTPEVLVEIERRGLYRG